MCAAWSCSASILLTVGALAVWVERVVLDTPTWTDTSAKVLADPRSGRRSRRTWSTSSTRTSTSRASCATRCPRARSRSRPRRPRGAARTCFARERPARARLARRPRPPGAPRTARAQRQLNRLLDDGDGALTTTNGAVVLDLRPLVERGSPAESPCEAASARYLRTRARSSCCDRISSRPRRDGAHGTERHQASARAAGRADLRPRDLARPRSTTSRCATCAIGVLVSGLVLIFVRRVLGDQLIDRLVKNDCLPPRGARRLVDRHRAARPRDRVDHVRRRRRR